MLRAARFRVVFAVVALLTAAVPPAGADSRAVEAEKDSSPPSCILVGFVGGFVRHDNPHHGPVQFAHRIQTWLPPDAHVEIFENRRRKAAYQTIVHLLDANHDGVLSAEEKSRARIILFGTSWGAAAVVMLARDLSREKIPVLLTVQIDSVAKLGQNDSVIPENVAEAANFYQPHGLFHGRAVIRAADSSKTKILGNFRFDYRQSPVHCEGYSWADRTLTPDHMQSECDPKLWQQVEDLVRERIENEKPRELAAAE